MKRSILLFILLFILKTAHSQVYFGYGYGMNFTSVKGLNKVVSNYNSTRPWLDKEMKNFSYVDGLVINLGGGFAATMFDMEFGFRSQKRIAKGTGATGVAATREVKLRQNVFAFTFGGYLVETHGGFGFGLRTEFGEQKALTRVFETGGDKGDWNKIKFGGITNVGPAVKIFIAPGEGGVVTIAMYYTFGMVKANASDLERALNNKDLDDSENDAFKNRNGVFGITVVAGVFGG